MFYHINILNPICQFEKCLKINVTTLTQNLTGMSVTKSSNLEKSNRTGLQNGNDVNCPYFDIIDHSFSSMIRLRLN